MIGSMGCVGGAGGDVIALSPVSVGPTATGAVSQLTSNLSGTVTWSKVSGASNLAVASNGAVSVTAALGAGGTNVFVARATNAAGDAVEKSFTLTGVAVPAAPTIAVTSSSGQNSIAITDGANNGAAITAHKVYRGLTSGGETLLGTFVGTSLFVDTGLTNGTTYYYKVSAVNSVGEGALSAEASGVPSATLPIGKQLVVSYTSTAQQAQTTATGYVHNEVRIGHYVGPNSASNIQIVYGNFYMASSAPYEIPISNDITTEYALELASSTPFQWGGIQSTTFAGGTGAVKISDVMSATLTAGALIHTRKRDSIADDTKLFLSQTKTAPDLEGRRMAKASQLLNTGAFNSASTSSGGSAFPMLVLGVPTAPQASFLIIGDSIANGQNDSNTITTGGFWQQALSSVNGTTPPWHRQAEYGSSLTAHLPANSPLSKLIWPYVTDIYVQPGTYEISTGMALADVQALFMTICDYARSIVGPYGRKLRVHATTILPRIHDSPTSYADYQQNPVAGFEVGGICDQYNAWLKSLVGSKLDSVADIRSVVADPAHPSAWISNGTANYATPEGIHPNPPLHALMAPVLNTDMVPFLDVNYRVAPEVV